MTREITAEERDLAATMLSRARAAMAEIADYDQARVDRLAQAIGWAVGNEATFTRLGQMGVDESGAGDRAGRPAKRFKIHGILRDALRQPSVGVIEEDPEKGIVKYAKPAGVIASIVPMTNPALTPPGTAINAIKAKDAVIFSPHPRTKRTTYETVEIMRAVMAREGAPADIFQCVEEPSIPLAQELMAVCDMTLATGGPAMVKAAYSSGKPAFGVGQGNSTMVIDETADIEEAARNTRTLQDFRLRVRLLGGRQHPDRRHDLRPIRQPIGARRRISRHPRGEGPARTRHVGPRWHAHHRDRRPACLQTGGRGRVRHP